MSTDRDRENLSNGRAPLREASDAEIHQLVDEVLRTGKHLTAPTGGAARPPPIPERLHARVVAAQMQRLAQQISRAPEPSDPAPDDCDEWWFELDGKRIGPISLRKVRYLWEEGELTPDSLCWHEGFTSWVSLFRVSELAEALAPRSVAAPRAQEPVVPEAPASTQWKPSAAAALESANRERLAQTQKPPPSAPVPLEAAADERDDRAGSFVALPPGGAASSPAKRRSDVRHAVVSGLAAGLVIAAAVLLARALWPVEPSPPVMVVVREPQPAAPAPPPSPPPASSAPAAPKAKAKREPKVEVAAQPPKRKPVTVEEAFVQEFSPGPDELDTSEVFGVVAAHKAEVDACVRAQKTAHPDASGRLVMRWKVHLDGHVSHIGVASQELADLPLAACLEKAIAGWTFPKHEVPHAPIEFPFSY